MPTLVSAARPPDGGLSSLPHAVWRADQMASGHCAVTATGHALLDKELPNGGWPKGSLIELLMEQPGIGEIRLLRSTFSAIAGKRRIALVQPPHLPHVSAWANWGLPIESLLWIQAARSADALWSAEQILNNGSCGALLFWQSHLRTESLRRLHLAAQGSDTLFWLMRPLACMRDASPAPLRLALRPAAEGLQIQIVKRRGPLRDDPILLRMDDMPAAPHPFNAPQDAPSRHLAGALAENAAQAPAAASLAGMMVAEAPAHPVI